MGSRPDLSNTLTTLAMPSSYRVALSLVLAALATVHATPQFDSTINNLWSSIWNFQNEVSGYGFAQAQTAFAAAQRAAAQLEADRLVRGSRPVYAGASSASASSSTAGNTQTRFAAAAGEGPDGRSYIVVTGSDGRTRAYVVPAGSNTPVLVTDPQSLSNAYASGNGYRSATVGSGTSPSGTRYAYASSSSSSSSG